MPAARKSAKTKKTTSKASQDAREKREEGWSILASLRRPFANRDAKWPVRRRVRQAEEEPPVPEAYAGTAIRHKSRELDFMVRQVTALLGDNREQYVVYATSETEDMQRLADDCQKAISALMELLEDQYPMGRPRDIAHDRQTAEGLAIEKLTFNWDFFKKLTKGSEEDWQSAFERFVREKRKLPLRRVPVDPLTCYWEYDIDGLAAVAEYGKVRRSALKDTYKNEVHLLDALARIPNSENTTNENNATTGGITTGGYQDNGDLVTFYEIWTRSEFWLMVEGEEDDEREVLVRQNHPFGRPPYFFAPAIVTGSTDPLHQFQPLVNPLYQTTLELSMVRTARFNAAYLSSFKPFYIQYDNGNAEMDEESGGLKVHFLTPGNNIPSLKGGKIVPIDWTDLDELVALEQSLMGDRDRFGFQAILAGNTAASGESTAWATRMLRDQGMIQFNGVMRNYAQMREEEIHFIMDFCRDVLKTDLPIAQRVDLDGGRGVTKVLKLTKKMVNAGLDVQVRVTASKATDRIAIVEEYRRAHEAGEVPLRMVLTEGWGFSNATEIMDEVIDEQIMRELMPKAIELVFQIGVAGALDALKKELPEEAPPSPAEVEAQMQQEQDALAQQQQQQQVGPDGTPLPGAIEPGTPPGGEIPGGVVEPGMGAGLVPQEIPPEQPTGFMPTGQ